jgi:hypothetical protein
MNWWEDGECQFCDHLDEMFDEAQEELARDLVVDPKKW